MKNVFTVQRSVQGKSRPVSRGQKPLSRYSTKPLFPQFLHSTSNPSKTPLNPLTHKTTTEEEFTGLYSSDTAAATAADGRVIEHRPFVHGRSFFCVTFKHQCKIKRPEPGHSGLGQDVMRFL